MEKLSTLFESDSGDTVGFEKIVDLIEKNGGQYGYDIAMLSAPDCVTYAYETDIIFDVTEEESTTIYSLAFHKLLAEANGGNASSMYRIASFYQCGFPPVEADIKICLEWLTRSFEAGFLFAANDLFSAYISSGPEVYDREKADYFLSVLEANPSIRVIALYPEDVPQFETENGSILIDPDMLRGDSER